MDRFMRESEQEKVTGLSRTTRWRLEREGKFPKSYSISGGNAKGRLESEIQAWLDRIVGENEDAAPVKPEASDAA